VSYVFGRSSYLSRVLPGSAFNILLVDICLMYLSDAVTAIVVVVLNVVVGLSTHVAFNSQVLSLFPLQPLVVALCGFLVSRFGWLTTILAELSYIVSITMTYSSTSSLIMVSLAYMLGVIAGLTKRKDSFELKLELPVSYHHIMISLGCSVVGSGILGLVKAPLVTPLAVAVSRGTVSTELIISILTSYGVQAYLSSLYFDVNVVALALVSFFTPYTLPLFPVLTAYSGTYTVRRRLKLGRVVETIKGAKVRELVVPYEKGLNRNLVITGSTGTGKSTLAKQLVRQLKDLGIPVVVLDPHGEYCHDVDISECVDASELAVDLLRAYEDDPQARSEFIADAVSEIYPLGSLQRIALVKALSHLYSNSRERVSFDHLLEYLWRAADGDVDLGVPQPVIRSLIPYIESLKSTFKSYGERITDVVDLVTVVDFSKLSTGVSRIVAELVVDELYHNFKDLNKEVVLVVDEAHRFLRRGVSIARIFREGRKYGISAILITQDISSIPRDSLLNSAAIISFSVPEVSAARYIAKVVSPDDQALYEKVLRKLMSLPQFHALAHVVGRGSYIIKLEPKPPNYLSR